MATDTAAGMELGWRPNSICVPCWEARWVETRPYRAGGCTGGECDSHRAEAKSSGRESRAAMSPHPFPIAVTQSSSQGEVRALRNPHWQEEEGPARGPKCVQTGLSGLAPTNFQSLGSKALKTGRVYRGVVWLPTQCTPCTPGAGLHTSALTVRRGCQNERTYKQSPCMGVPAGQGEAGCLTRDRWKLRTGPSSKLPAAEGPFPGIPCLQGHALTLPMWAPLAASSCLLPAQAERDPAPHRVVLGAESPTPSLCRHRAITCPGQASWLGGWECEGETGVRWSSPHRVGLI